MFIEQKTLCGRGYNIAGRVLYNLKVKVNTKCFEKKSFFDKQEM